MMYPTCPFDLKPEYVDEMTVDAETEIKHKTGCVRRVVRKRQRCDFQCLQDKRLQRPQPECLHSVNLNRRVNRQICEVADLRDMVGVVMGDQQRVNLFPDNTGFRQ